MWLRIYTFLTAKTAYAAQETRRRAVKGKAKGGMQSRTEGGEKELNREQTGVQGGEKKVGGGAETTHGLKKLAWGLMMKTWVLKEHILGLKEPIHFLRKPLYFLKAALDTLPEPIHFSPKKPRGFTPKRGATGRRGG